MRVSVAVRLLTITLLILCAATVAVNAGSQGAKGSTKPAVIKPPMEIFLDNCAKCHGTDGNADTFMGRKHMIPKFSSDEVQKLSDKELTAIIRNGKNRMPAWDDRLSSEEIARVLTVVRGFSPLPLKSNGAKH